MDRNSIGAGRSDPETVTGRVSVHPRGFGFLNIASDSGKSTSAFITPPDLNPFLTDDVVTARVVTGSDGRSSATALSLVTRERRELFGEVVTRGRRTGLRVDREVSNTDWPLDGGAEDLRAGDFVVGRIDGHQVVFKRRISAGADGLLEKVIARYNLSSEFSPEALAEAQRMGDPSLGSRRDLRSVPTMTVDAPSTRDIDDAVSVLPAAGDGALRILVSIADPSEFVVPGSALDEEARARGTSVYLADRVLPMLPEGLSTDRLSLLPGQDRGALTVEMRIDSEGKVTAADIFESVIRSWARLDYDEVGAFLDRNEVSAAMEPMRDVMPWFRTAASRLEIARQCRGGVRMVRDEARLFVDSETGAAGMEIVRPNSAHSMIERLMVAANEAVAQWLHDRGVPAIYRVHPEPDAERVVDLASCAHYFGYEAGFGDRLSPLSLAAFDAQITGAASEPAIRSVLRRALGPARYAVTPGLHFGLASPRYLHFTSPIRRYADLAVHRAVKSYLRGHRTFIPHDPAVEALAVHLNGRALASSRAETDRHRMLVASVMSRHLGEIHPARITRIRSFGVVAQIDATMVEGLISLESLPGGPYRPDEREVSLVSADRTFTVGMPVTVRIRAADPVLGRIDYDLVETERS